MRSEKEILDILNKCFEVSGFGMSNGPCPLKENEKKECKEDCPYEDKDPNIAPEELEKIKQNCCKTWDERLGCCAECSFPSALSWVLGSDTNGSDNGQKKLVKALGDLE